MRLRGSEPSVDLDRVCHVTAAMLPESAIGVVAKLRIPIGEVLKTLRGILVAPSPALRYGVAGIAALTAVGVRADLADKLGSRFHSDGLSMRNLLEDNRRVIGCRGALPRRVHRGNAGQRSL
jgi:hypothetical protein